MMYSRRILVEAKAVIDLGTRRYHWQTDADYEKDLKADAADLMQFIRDHRSRDGYGIDIETVYENRCLYGSHEPEEDEETGEPICCRKAAERWQADEYCKIGVVR